MDSMHRLARAAIDQVPPQVRLTREQAELIPHYGEQILSLGPDIVQGFYDTLYAHPATAAVFVEGERPQRERTLVDWATRTCRGPIDDDYWAWMAMVGLVHLTRRVSNSMMLAMTDYVATFIEDNVHRLDIPEEDKPKLAMAFRQLVTQNSAIISYGYDHAVSSALFEVAGMPEELLARLTNQEVTHALVDARSELGQR